MNRIVLVYVSEKINAVVISASLQAKKFTGLLLAAGRPTRSCSWNKYELGSSRKKSCYKVTPINNGKPVFTGDRRGLCNSRIHGEGSHEKIVAKLTIGSIF